MLHGVESCAPLLAGDTTSTLHCSPPAARRALLSISAAGRRKPTFFGEKPIIAKICAGRALFAKIWALGAFVGRFTKTKQDTLQNFGPAMRSLPHHVDLRCGVGGVAEGAEWPPGHMFPEDDREHLRATIGDLSAQLAKSKEDSRRLCERVDELMRTHVEQLASSEDELARLRQRCVRL